MGMRGLSNLGPFGPKMADRGPVDEAWVRCKKSAAERPRKHSAKEEDGGMAQSENASIHCLEAVSCSHIAVHKATLCKGMPQRG